jgi:NADH:ubiquinone oxidoreductase subunit 3 (subunit A)
LTTELVDILGGAIIAFVLIFIATYAIYAIGRRSAPKTKESDNEQMAYACGEKAVFHEPKMNISLYKYIIYFVIFDSAVLLLAFAAVAIAGTFNPLYMILYMGILLASGYVLLEGGKD